MPGLLDRRLIFVTGKGGVGKSTIALALGLLAARHGRRTIVAELAGQGRARAAFAADPQPEDAGSDDAVGALSETPLAPDLFTVSVDPESAMEEYLRLRTGALGQALGGSRVFQAFAMATPGMRELLTMGKVWELAQFERRSEGAAPYDVVIVDSPAAGHGLGILRTPRTFSDIARVGPIAGLAGRIAATIADPGFTAVCAVALAEEMPVNETLWLADELAQESLALSAVVVNGLYAERFTEVESRELARARRGSDVLPAAAAALGAALSEHARARAQRGQLARLRAELATETVELPYLYAASLGPVELGALADRLAAAGVLGVAA